MEKDSNKLQYQIEFTLWNKKSMIFNKVVIRKGIQSSVLDTNDEKYAQDVFDAIGLVLKGYPVS